MESAYIYIFAATILSTNYRLSPWPEFVLSWSIYYFIGWLYWYIILMYLSNVMNKIAVCQTRTRNRWALYLNILRRWEMNKRIRALATRNNVIHVWFQHSQIAMFPISLTKIESDCPAWWWSVVKHIIGFLAVGRLNKQSQHVTNINITWRALQFNSHGTKVQYWHK